MNGNITKLNKTDLHSKWSGLEEKNTTDVK